MKTRKEEMKTVAFILGIMLLLPLVYEVGYVTGGGALSNPGTTYGPGDIEAYSYIVYSENSTYYAKNGTTRIVEFGPDSNKTYVIQLAINALSSGGTIFLKDIQIGATNTYGNNIFIVESYQGTLKLYSNQGKGFLLTQLASDPDTTGWGASQAGYWWFNTADGKIKFWDGTQIQVLPSISGGPPSGNVVLSRTYTVYVNGSTYYAEDDFGNIDFSSSTASTTINNALSAGSGAVLLRKGSYPISTALALGTDDILEGEGEGATFLNATGSNHDVITIGSDGSITYSVGIRNLRIDCSAGSSNITGIRQWRIFYSRFENLFITGSSSADRLRYGWYVEQEADGDHSTDNTYVNIRILNFYDKGFVAEDFEDSQLLNFNIGTQNNGATACFYWETPNVGRDAGGSGVFVTNFHFWGLLSAGSGNTTYGIYISGQYNGVFRSHWTNVYGGDVMTGIYMESGDAAYNTFVLVHISTCTTYRIDDDGTGNVFTDYRASNTWIGTFTPPHG